MVRRAVFLVRLRLCACARRGLTGVCAGCRGPFVNRAALLGFVCGLAISVKW